MSGTEDEAAEIGDLCDNCGDEIEDIDQDPDLDRFCNPCLMDQEDEQL